MKSVRSFLVVAAAGLALAAGLAFAQTESGPAPEHHGMHGHMMGGPEFGMFLHQLNLTDDQKAQIKQIFQTEKPNMKPIMQAEMQARLKMMQLITSGKSDQETQAAIASTAQQESQVHLQMEKEHAKIGAQIYQLLSSDQKSKVADMIAKHQQRMQEHLQKQSAAPEQQ